MQEEYVSVIVAKFQKVLVTYLFDIGIIEVHPNLEFGMEKECGVVFAVVRDNANKLMLNVLSPSLFGDLVENIG